ncbi:hypothetical protein ACFO4L_13220 [Bacillus daqingensis]|uniref:Citrate transporter-like domain-containing protein n=1 Tax=Bacillus daqingensis TaxID=872396 RepID=A0ABV9NZM0_9BACI
MRWIQPYLYMIYTPVIALYLLVVFTGNPLLEWMLAPAAVVLLVLSYPGAPRLFKILGAGFMGAGAVFHWYAGGSLVEIPFLLTDNYGLLALLLMLPWMKSVVESGKFDRKIAELLRVNADSLGSLYPRSLFTSVILTAFLNLSAAPISQGVLRRNLASLPVRLRNTFISRATLRGNSLALIWSPLEVLIALTIFITGTAYLELLPWLLLIALLMFCGDALWNYVRYRNEPLDQEGMVSLDWSGWKRLAGSMIHLFAALSIFLAAVIIMGNVTGFDFILTVTLLIFPFAFCWSLVLRRRRRFLRIGWQTWKEKTNTMQHFFVLFLTLSFFAAALEQTGLLELLEAPVMYVQDYPILVFMLIQITFVFLSLFGVHPIATIGILSSLSPLLMSVISPLSLSIILITSSIATLTVNTYGLFVQITSANLSENPYRISLHNLGFAGAFFIVSIFVAYLVL